jgi:P27 family predicted phage terminase small subunit
MARRQLSDTLHTLKGTEAAPRDPKVIPLAMQGGRPVCPRHLSKTARKEWLAAVKLLEARCTLDPAAGPTLELYAETRSRWLEAKADINTRGLLITIQKSTSKGELYDATVENPMLDVAQTCEAQLMQLTKTLGIAPDSREKVQKVKAVGRASNLPLWLQPIMAADKEQENERSSETDGD